MQEVEIGEDYDEETDEFAGYSGSNAHQYSMNAAGHSIASTQQSEKNQYGLQQSTNLAKSKMS